MRTNRSCWSVAVCDELDETCGVGRVAVKSVIVCYTQLAFSVADLVKSN